MGAPFTGSNANPTAVDDTATATEDTPATIAVLANDSDPDGDALALLSVGAPAHGTAAANPDGTVTYTPALNYNGADTFTYVASDTEGGSASATVTVTITPVNDAPAASNDSYSTAEDTALIVAAPGVLANDSDVDGDAMTAVMVSTTSNGTLTLNGDGSFTYLPDPDYNGSDSFSYKASDGTLSSSTAQRVSITVLAVNDAPVARADSFTLDEDTTLAITAPGVLSNDTDAEGDALSAIVMTGAGHGSVTLNADGSFVYTPAANFNGTDSFTYSANDGLGFRAHHRDADREPGERRAGRGERLRRDRRRHRGRHRGAGERQ